MTPFIPSRSIGRSNRGGPRDQRQFGPQHPTSRRAAVGDDSEHATNGANGRRPIGGSRNTTKSRNQGGAPHQAARGLGKSERRPRPSKNRASPSASAGPSPFGVGLTNQDRAEAVLRWNLTPGNIATEEAQACERNRALRLAREAREKATGVKEPPPAQPSLVESFKRMDVQAAEGETASRAAMGSVIRGSIFGPEAVVSESNPI